MRQRALYVMDIIAVAVLTASCGAIGPSVSAITGSGHVISDGRAVGDFSSVEVRGPLVVHVTAGVNPSAMVTGDDNLLPLVSTTVTSGRLVIELPSNTSISTTTPLMVAVGTSRLASLTGQAASRITLDRIASSELSVTLDGASQVTASGNADHLVVSTSAASIARLGDLAVRHADVVLHAASVVELTAADAVRGEAHDASVLRVHGNPPVVSVDTSEMSRVSQ